MTPWLEDTDLTVWCGDALETLRGMADGSVDCVVTSPPYWGLRDYGTGEWEGGNPDCDHQGDERWYTESTAATSSAGAFSEPGEANKERLKKGRWREAGKCVKCGAQRVDRQLGLEATPDQYVARMVEVFREVRRVLASHGTCWVNLGDTYNANQGAGFNGQVRQDHANRHTVMPRSGFKAKDLVGIPWLVAFALRADGWYLRSDIIWSKPNPMPESVTDRPTKAHEYVFLLTKGPRYWFDAEAVREPHTGLPPAHYGREGYKDGRALDDLTRPSGITNGAREYHPAGRNVRSVWEIATQPYPEAHFATFPEELARRCIVAGCPAEVCRVCGKPRERIVERGESDYARMKAKGVDWQAMREAAVDDGKGHDSNRAHIGGTRNEHGKAFSYTAAERTDLGWSDCDCGQHLNDRGELVQPWDKYRPGVVLDPFGGSGTVAHVARKHGRRAVLIELNEQYCELIARRTAQQSLLAIDPEPVVPMARHRGLTGGAYSPPGQSPHSNDRAKP